MFFIQKDDDFLEKKKKLFSINNTNFSFIRPPMSRRHRLPPQTSESEHVSGAHRGSAHNAYRSDLNSVTTDNFASSWGSIRARSEYATCHFCIREHAVQSGTFSLVFVIILQAKLVSSRGLECQMIYSSPRCRLLSSEESGAEIYLKLSLSPRMQSTREG